MTGQSLRDFFDLRDIVVDNQISVFRNPFRELAERVADVRQILVLALEFFENPDLLKYGPENDGCLRGAVRRLVQLFAR